MTVETERDPGFEALKRLCLEMAGLRSVDTLLQTIVNRLAEQPHVALARIWLMGPGDICPSCPMREECADRTRCAHLVASAGNPLSESAARWSRLDGDFRRFPLGVRKVGHIAATGEPVAIMDVSEDPSWLARPDWARKEKIVGLGGQPLIHQGEVLGVLAVFTRRRLGAESMLLQRMIAGHAASAIANARAFEEIERLRHRLELENEYLREEVKSVHAFGDIIGDSSALQKVLSQIELVAPTDTNVLVLGESGTGKELIARAIHDRSSRRERPLIKVNCASIPRDLFESEFFGHVKGAFTGAVKDRVGRFERADGGSLLLDEVGEIPLDLQSKLLRVLQEGSFERVGDDRTRQVDVRVIAATNRDLKQEVEARRFRQDLFFRLSVFPLEVPPLRDRMEDVPALAAHFIERSCRRLGVPEMRLTRRHVADLRRYDWPGNVRELENAVERAVITARGGALRFDLPSGERPPPRPAVSAAPPGAHDIRTYDELKDLERANLHAALESTGWKVSGADGAAELLGVRPTTLASRMKAMGVRRPPGS